MTAEFLAINIPLMALFFSLWAGIPLWLVLKHPDRDPRETRAIPLYLRKKVARSVGMPAQRKVPVSDEEMRRAQVLVGQR